VYTFLELNPRGIGRLPKVVKDDVLDLNIDVWKRRIVPIRRYEIVFALLLNHSVLTSLFRK